MFGFGNIFARGLMALGNLIRFRHPFCYQGNVAVIVGTVPARNYDSALGCPISVRVNGEEHHLAVAMYGDYPDNPREGLEAYQEALFGICLTPRAQLWGWPPIPHSHVSGVPDRTLLRARDPGLGYWGGHGLL